MPTLSRLKHEQEVRGRNRELTRLAASASPRSRELFQGYIELLGQAELLPKAGNHSVRLDELRVKLEKHSRKACEEAAANATRLLRETSRWRLLDLQGITDVPSGPAYARFAWMLGVAGAENEAAGGSLRDYFLGAATWYSESLIRLVANPADTSLLSILPAAQRGRIDAGSTRFRWVCDLFAEGIEEWANNSGGRRAVLFGGGRTQSFSDAIRQSLPLPERSALRNLHPDVLSALTATPTPGADFNSLLEGNGPETRPLIRLGDQTYIGNAFALVLSEEIALISAIKETLGSGDQGDAFEYACHYIAEHLLPPDVHPFRGSFVSDSLAGTDGDEVDLYLSGKGLHVVIEAKSHLPGKDAKAAANNFHELLKANEQVKRRVTRLREGRWIRRKHAVKEDHVSGMVVSLHDYMSHVWRPHSMVEGGTPPFIAMPVHAFAMVLGCVRDKADLAGFLTLRSAIGAAGVSGGDELEVLLGWMSGWTAASIPTEPDAVIRMRPYSIETDRALDARWSSTEDWRQALFSMSEAVH